MSTSRLPASFSSQTQSSADDFGLVAWLEQTRIRLPLRGVEARFHVAGTLARVELTQIFQNTREVPLDISYQFPLPAAASVFRCELIADGRTIAAVVESEDEARRQFAQAKSEGRRAAIVETRRDNLFQLRLGNIQPREIVAIRLGYVQELERAVRTVSLRIPVCPGERYVPGQPLLRSNQGKGATDDTDQVPDASLISPPRIDALHPDAALFHLCGELPSAGVQLTSVLSPSHLIAVREAGEQLRVGFVGDGNVPDSDFILRWELPELAPGTAQLLAGPHGERRYGLLRFMPPALPVTVQPAPRQLWFLIDRSGSMQGARWQRTCQALLECVGGLRPEDRVSVTFFESSFQHFAEKPLSPDALLADPRFRMIESLGTAGGTEVLPALQAVLAQVAQHRDPAARAHLVLITDGQVANESAVLAALKPHADLTVHTIGIDTAVNDGLLQKMARDHGGRSMMLSPAESVSEAVELVLRGGGAPALRDLRLLNGVTSPDPLPVIASGGLEISRAIEGEWTDGVPLLAATSPDGTTWSCAPLPAAADGEVLRLIAARRQIDGLQRQGQWPAALALARQTNLICAGASFIAIDRVSKVAVAAEEVEQPNIECCFSAEVPVARGFCGVASHILSPGTDRPIMFHLVDPSTKWEAIFVLLTRDAEQTGMGFRAELERSLRGETPVGSNPLPPGFLAAFARWWRLVPAVAIAVRNLAIDRTAGRFEPSVLADLDVFLAMRRDVGDGSDLPDLGSSLAVLAPPLAWELAAFRKLVATLRHAPATLRILLQFRQNQWQLVALHATEPQLHADQSL